MLPAAADQYIIYIHSGMSVLLRLAKYTGECWCTSGITHLLTLNDTLPPLPLLLLLWKVYECITEQTCREADYSKDLGPFAGATYSIELFFPIASTSQPKRRELLPKTGGVSFFFKWQLYFGIPSSNLELIYQSDEIGWENSTINN